MAHVLSLIADKAKTSLDHEFAERISRQLLGAGLDPAEPVWLAPGEALEFAFSGDPETAADIARTIIGTHPIDRAVTGRHRRRKKALVADMDSTVIGQECIDELADEFGVGPQVAAITERAMRGEIAFEQALRERVGLLKGMPVATAEEVLAKRITLTPGAGTLVATMAAAGAATVLVTGGFTLFADRIGRQLGFSRARANKLEIEGNRLTGRVAEPILGRQGKRAALEETAEGLGLDLADTLAIGDGANDLDMLARAGLGVAFHAKPKVRGEARVAIDHADLAAVLFLQGYRRDEFAG